MQHKLMRHMMLSLLILAVLLVGLAVGRTVLAGAVQDMNSYAWGANVGWINLNPTHGGVTVFNDHLEGDAWGENIGWVRFQGTAANGDPYGVNVAPNGALSGYAWGANVGWINFNPTHGGVTVDLVTGEFSGDAWGENIGWVRFQGMAQNGAVYGVQANFPEIEVLGNGQPIANGSTVPSATDGTDFGAVAPNPGSVNRSFTISNSGASTLTISLPVSIIGAGAAHFQVIAQPPAEAPAGASTAFTVQFAPQATGIHTATVSIANNDPNEDPYEFAIVGTGTQVSLTVTKALSPTNDDGRFILYADGNTGAEEGDGATATATIDSGATIPFGETAGRLTDLAHYDTVYTCDNGGPSGFWPGDSLTMPFADVTCTFTNTRKMRTLTVVKALAPATDPGLFIMDANGTLGAEGGHGAWSSALVPVGANVSFGELAGSGTNLTAYSTTYRCDDRANNFPIFTRDDPANTSGDGIYGILTMPFTNVTCTFSNVANSATDLKLQKFVKPDGAITAGKPFTYTLFVDNLGPAVASNVVVSDTLFADGEFILLSVSDDRGVCAVSTPQDGSSLGFECTLAQLDAGQRWTVTAQVVAYKPMDVNNEARVFTPNHVDPDMSNNSDSASMHVVFTADVGVEKMAVTSPIDAGATATWLLTVTNAGPSSAENVQLFDILPAAILADTVVITPDTLGCTIGTPGDVENPTVCNLGTIPTNIEGTLVFENVVVLTVSGTVDPGYTASPGIYNDVSVISDTPDLNGANNRATSAIALKATGDLTVFKQSMPGTVLAGEAVAYTIDVSSGAPSMASNVVLSDTLPAAFAYGAAQVVGGDGSECIYTPGPELVTCVLGDMASGVNKQVRIHGTIRPETETGAISNWAQVSSGTAPDARSSAVTTIFPPSGVLDGQLAVRKTATKGGVHAGESLGYEIVVETVGAMTAPDVVVRDDLPDQVEFVGYEIAGNAGECIGNSLFDPEVICHLGDMARGESRLIRIETQVKPGTASGVIRNQVLPDPRFVGGQLWVTTAVIEPMIWLPLIMR